MKKLLSVLLAIVMVFTLAVMPASAETATTVVYYVNGEAVKTVDSLVEGDEYTVDYIPANTNEQYFSGWYYDSEFTNEARTKFTLASGENKLYARMEDYKKTINLSTNIEEGEPVNAYKWLEIENAWPADKRWFAGYYRYYNNEVQDILPLLSTLHHICNTDGTVYSKNTQSWAQSGVFVLVDGEGNAIVPKPSTKYKVTVKMNTNIAVATSISLQTAWKFSDVAMYSSGNTTFGSNRVHQNGNNAHEYGSANFKTTQGTVSSSAVTSQATTEEQTLTFEITTPSLNTYIDNQYFQILGFRISSLAASSYVSFHSVKIEQEVANVEYFNADGSSAGRVDGLDIGSQYKPDRMPTQSSEEGKFFAGWKTSDGEMVTSNGITLGGGDNNLYAVYASNISEEKTVSLYNENIANGKLYSPHVLNDVYNGHIPYQYNGGYGPKTEVKEGTDAPYTRFTSGQYNGKSATYLFDENAVPLQAKWNTTYTFTIKYRMPVMAEAYPMTIQPVFGINKAKVNSVSAVDMSGTTVKTVAWANGLNKYWAYTFKGGADEYRFSNNTAINDNAASVQMHNIVQPTSEWQTLTFVISTGSEDANYLPLFALYVNVGGGNNSNVLEIKDVTVKECRVDNNLQYTTIAGKEVAYAKVADYVEDKETYKVTLYGAANSWADFAFMTADETSINDNQGFIEAANKPVVSFGYGGTYTKTVYITIDKYGEGQGDALYLYITNGVEKVKTISVIEVEKLTNAEGESLVGNKGVSMLEGRAEDETQALRYYFTYDTATGEDIVIDGVSYTLKSRGFLLANADAVGYNSVTRASAAVSNSGIIDVNIAENFNKCWKNTTNTDGTANLWFSTHVKGFKAEDGTYNASQRLYVKGYVVINVNGNDVVLYSAETTLTVKEVYDFMGAK